MSFAPEKIPENPRMAPEKYGMYVNLVSKGQGQQTS